MVVSFLPLRLREPSRDKKELGLLFFFINKLLPQVIEIKTIEFVELCFYQIIYKIFFNIYSKKSF